jgi:UDP-glucose 4-epimerase
VIGGAGFIGTWLVRALLASGRDVTAMGRSAAPPPGFPAAARYVAGDYADRGRLRETFGGVDEVIDLAYATVPQTSYADPVFDIQANLPPSVGLLEEALAAGLKRVVFVSSGGTVYGPTDRLPIGEDAPTWPVSPYGITKLTIEKYARMFHRLHGLPVTIVRPGNAYGPGQRPFSGQGFIATAVATVLSGGEIPLFGAGDTVRDYVYVNDVASGILAALQDGAPGEIYNIGTGIGRSTAEVVAAIRRLAEPRGYRARTRSLPSRGFDVPANVLDAAKLVARTRWRPQTAFDAGLAATWEAMLAGSSTDPPRDPGR